MPNPGAASIVHTFPSPAQPEPKSGNALACLGEAQRSRERVPTAIGYRRWMSLRFKAAANGSFQGLTSIGVVQRDRQRSWRGDYGVRRQTKCDAALAYVCAGTERNAEPCVADLAKLGA
jgi:hypothetical protein